MMTTKEQQRMQKAESLLMVACGLLQCEVNANKERERFEVARVLQDFVDLARKEMEIDVGEAA